MIPDGQMSLFELARRYAEAEGHCESSAHSGSEEEVFADLARVARARVRRERLLREAFARGELAAHVFCTRLGMFYTVEPYHWRRQYVPHDVFVRPEYRGATSSRLAMLNGRALLVGRTLAEAFLKNKAANKISIDGGECQQERAKLLLEGLIESCGRIDRAEMERWLREALPSLPGRREFVRTFRKEAGLSKSGRSRKAGLQNVG